MKLRKTDSSTEVPAGEGGGVAIAARFQLDADPRAAKSAPAGVGKTSALIALIAALGALVLIAFSAWMMYSDWAIASTT